MSKFKKIIISFAISVVLYGLFSYIYNMYIKEPYQSIYVLNKDLAKNEVIKEEYLEEIKTISFPNMKEYISKDEIIKEKGNIVTAYSTRFGQVLTKNIIARKDEELAKIEGYEYISLDIKSSGAAVSYKAKKGSIVNVYYTAKSKAVAEVLASKEKIYSSNNVDSDVTCRLLENIEIIEVYDTKMASGSGAQNGSASSIKTFDTIVVRVNAKDALIVSNLKEQGEFNLTMVS